MRAVILVALLSTAAGAYPSMIRHGYVQCAACHTDPSGGTLLTDYGRAQSELLLSSRWNAKGDEEASTGSRFLFGAITPPESTVLGGWLREGYIWNLASGKLVDRRALQMRADLAGEISAGPLRAAGQIGYASSSGAELAAVTRDGSVVSREHWLGLSFASGAGLLRGGRFNLPFGLRNLEHISFVRAATRTDINEGQQDGLAVALSGESWRSEVMAILGNPSVRPDAFRERGASGYLEITPASRIAVGLSALAARSTAALDTGLPTLRQAYGVTARAAPWTALVISAEFDALINSSLGRGVGAGHGGWLQADLEVLRGVHLVSALEDLHAPAAATTQTGIWGGAAWFVVPHLDVRADWVRRSSTDTFLVQLNGYL